MITYLFHCTLLLSGFTIFYWLVLRHETYFKLNRWTIMGSVFLCLALPLIHIPSSLSLWSNNDAPTETIINTITQAPEVFNPISAGEPTAAPPMNSNESEAMPSSSSFSLMSILGILYLVGLIIFLLVFLLQIVVLLTQRYNLNSFETGKYTIVEMVKDAEPCSFLSYIFINPNKYDEDTYNHIIEHEKAHIDQSHHFDKIIAEILIILFWFNPLTWLLRKSISQNLEFLTDQSLLKKGVEKESYQMSLLKVSVSNKPLNLTASYNSSFLKNRISMMNTQNSSIVSSWKYLFVLPLFFLSVSCLNTTIQINTGSATTASEWKKPSSQNDNKYVTEDEYENEYAQSNSSITNNEKVFTRNLVMPTIEKIGLQIDGNVFVEYGEKQSVRIEGPEALLNRINTEVDGTNWEINYLENYKNTNYESPNFYITVAHITHLAISGTGNITTTNKFENLDDLYIAISGTGNIKVMADANFVNNALSGSGNITADINAAEANTVCSGSGNIILSGRATKTKFVSSGSGKLGGTNFKTKECTIIVSGSSVITADISDYLDVKADGGSLVRYKGNPKIKMEVSKSSQLQHLN